MKDTLKLFTEIELRTASHRLLDKLGLKYSPGARTQLDIHKLFSKLQLPKATEESLDIVSGVYFVAQIDDRTFVNNSRIVDIDTAIKDAKDEKYNGMYGYVSTAYTRTATADEINEYVNSVPDIEPLTEESDIIPALANRSVSNSAPSVSDMLAPGQAVVEVGNGETITFRALPIKNALVLGYLTDGTTVTVTEVNGEWATVIYNSSIGYVLTGYLKPAAAAS